MENELMKRFCRLSIISLTLVLAACSENVTGSTISSMENQEIEQKPVAMTNDKDPALSLEKRLDNVMAFSHFSGSVLLVKNDKVEIAKGYNMADRVNSRVNEPDTVYQIGSLSKAFTSAAILQLQEEGKLNINDPVTKYIRDYPYQKVTLYELLTHTAGIPNLTEFPDYISTMNIKVTTSENVAKFKDRPLEFEPDTQFHYSNSGYILLGEIIEVVSGESYNEFIQDHIFQELVWRELVI